MFSYYIGLALRSFKRARVLTVLMVLALALGIGACITSVTLLRLLSGDPMPQKSSRLFTPVIDPTSAQDTIEHGAMPQWWGNLMTYTDAMSLLNAKKAERQVVLSLIRAKIIPRKEGQRPFYSNGVISTADLFSMFDVPFEYGGGWSDQDDQSHARVAVIGESLNDRLFSGANSVGQSIWLNRHSYRIVGVIKKWAPQPRFYALNLGGQKYGDGDMVFLPLRSARADMMAVRNMSCWASGDMLHLETAPCAWVSMWVEFTDEAQASAYKRYLSNYVHRQIELGRLAHPKVWLYSLMGYLSWQQVVPGDVRSQTYLAFGFLLICIVNTMGLLLAKSLRRSREIGVRRALGATRREIFTQFIIESGMIGLSGGMLGLVFAEIGLWIIRSLPTQYAHLARLDISMFAATFALALIASLLSGLFPAWRACTVAPAPQLKSV